MSLSGDGSDFRDSFKSDRCFSIVDDSVGGRHGVTFGGLRFGSPMSSVELCH